MRPLHLANARPFGRLKAPLGLSLLRNRGILLSEENNKSEPFSYRKKVRIFYFSGSLPVDIPTRWEPQRNLAVRALRVAFADFSAVPWQGFEKSERGPNNSSLFQPQAAVVVVAVQVLLSAVAAKGKLPCKTKKTAIKSCLPCGASSDTAFFENNRSTIRF